ncbi:MAG: AAA-like domain-containing protein [Planctomycetota bacterium]|nr:AAA-like domain-containing protein [Planctomycetota bacterium]
MSTADSIHPQVLISYSHDSPAHQQRVLELSERLRSDGIDARLDQYSPWPPEGWPRWMERNLREAAFVLMVCTSTYRRRVTGDDEPGAGRGVCWEANLIYNDLYVQKITTSKYVPVVFSEDDAQHVPPVLQGHPQFRVGADDGYWQLYRRLTWQLEVAPRELGDLKKLAPLQPLGAAAAHPVAPPAAGPGRTTPSRKLFISYPHGDPDEENLARFLHGQLTESGHEVFIDMGLKAGSEWAEEIRARIRWCDYLVVLLSERSMHSEMVQTEVRLAQVHRRATGSPRTIPVRVRYFGPLEYELDLYLGRLQYVSWNGPDESDRVHHEILRAMATEPAAQLEPQVRPAAPPEPAAAGALNRPLKAQDTRSASVPGGTIAHSDPHYVSRKVDEVVVHCAAEAGHTLVIKGPRQMGKSSLLLHYLSECQKAGKKIAFVDFNIFSHEDLSGYATFLSRFAQLLGQRLRLAFSTPPTIDSQAAMVDFMERVILPQVGGPLVLALDEADRLFSRPYRADFFSMLRLWHNSRASLTPDWEDVDLALVISTEPYLLIDQGDRSPFNVGLLVEMEPFSRDECRVLNRTYGELLAEDEVEQLWTLLRGHPYLTRLSYYRLTAPDKVGFAELLERAGDERGPFGDHLRALLMKLHERPELLDAMQQVIRCGAVPNHDLYYRLYGAGLVRKEGQRINPANLLYARFFKTAL